MASADRVDVLIAGGGPSGLAAALQLGRARRPTLVVDLGVLRNRFADHAHGFLGQDGKSPAEIVAVAREQLKPYDAVRLLQGRVAKIAKDGAEFAVELESGAKVRARRVILAQGVRDILPPVDGLADLFGKSVFHCPYCHGYEMRDTPLSVLGGGDVAMHQAIMLGDWSKDIILFTNGAPLPADRAKALAQLQKRGVVLEETPIARVVAEKGAMTHVELTDGRRIPRNGMLIATKVVPNDDLHVQLGCETKEFNGWTSLVVDPRMQTTVAGVFAGGDVARVPHTLTFAVSDGMWAGIASHQSLLAEDFH